MSKLDIKWSPEVRKVSDLKEWSKNPRKISGDDYEKLKSDIQTYGFHDVLKVDSDGTILSGHQRRRALIELGIDEISVMVPDRKLTDQEMEIVSVASNVHRGNFDFDILANQFEIDNLIAAGMSKTDLNFFSLEEDDFNEEEELGKITDVKVKLGEIYMLGNHKILCGDSTKAEDWEQLMGNDKAQLIFTDPPYNVNYKSPGGLDYSSKKFGGTGGKMFNDNKSDAECLAFYMDVLKNLYQFSKDSVVLYWWFAHKNTLINYNAWIDTGWHFSQELVWIKNGPVFSAGQLYHRRYEPCMVGWKEGKKHYKNTKYSTFQDVHSLEQDDFELLFDTWYEKRDSTINYIHPTQKPIRLSERALKKNSDTNDIVIDAFGGSGSTLMGCEQANRSARLVEMDPKYVHAILNRWAKFTGRDPVREDGVAWSEISK